MNRLSPLIVRRVGAYAAPLQIETDSWFEPGAESFENLKLFAVGWLGGLVFFGTYFF